MGKHVAGQASFAARKLPEVFVLRHSRCRLFLFLFANQAQVLLTERNVPLLRCFRRRKNRVLLDWLHDVVGDGGFVGVLVGLGMGVVGGPPVGGVCVGAGVGTGVGAGVGAGVGELVGLGTGCGVGLGVGGGGLTFSSDQSRIIVFIE